MTMKSALKIHCFQLDMYNDWLYNKDNLRLIQNFYHPLV